MNNQRFTAVLFLMILTFVACKNEPKTKIETEPITTTVIRGEEPLKIVAKGFFNCLLNEEGFAEGNAKITVYQSAKSKIDSVKIGGVQDEITMNMYIYLFDGIGNYAFENNKEGQGIARGELIQMDGKTKEFFSTEGQVNFTSFDLDRKVASGKFKASYFYKSDQMPEVFDVTKGSFSNLPIEVIINQKAQ